MSGQQHRTSWRPSDSRTCPRLHRSRFARSRSLTCTACRATTTVLYGVGRVDASGRVKATDIVRALGWQAGDKLEVVTALGGIVIIASPTACSPFPISRAS